MRVHRVVKQGRDPLSVEASRINGGRYNAPGEFGALYCSLEEITATAEVFKGLRAVGENPATYPEGSWMLFELEIQADEVLDLTHEETLARLGLQPAMLTGTHPEVTQRLGREARDAGYQVILAPSAAVPGAKNLVLFLDRLSAPPRVLSSRPTLLS